MKKDKIFDFYNLGFLVIGIALIAICVVFYNMDNNIEDLEKTSKIQEERINHVNEYWDKECVEKENITIERIMDSEEGVYCHRYRCNIETKECFCYYGDNGERIIKGKLYTVNSSICKKEILVHYYEN